LFTVMSCTFQTLGGNVGRRVPFPVVTTPLTD